MNTPLIIDEAAYQDIVLREGNTHIVQIDFVDDNNIPIDLSDYKFQLSVNERSRQTIPDILFSTDDGDFVYVPTGSVLWTVNSNKTLNKEGSYNYNFDLVYSINNTRLTFLYGMFTIINKNF